DAAAHAVAVDGRHDRLREHVVLQQCVAHDAGGLGRGRQIAAYVGPRAECAGAGAGEDDAPAAAAVELVPEPGEVGHHLARHRVEPGRVVEREHHDVPAVLVDVDLHAQALRISGTTTTLPYARRSVRSLIASTLFSSGSR